MGDIDHAAIRKDAQNDARRLVEQHIDVQWFDELSRDEAKDALGYSWSNIIDLYPAGYAMRRGIENAVESLRNEGYVVSVGLDDGTLVIQVSISHDVFRNHRDADRSGSE